MVIARLTVPAFTALMLFGASAQAADFAPPVPPPVQPGFAGGWYLRGQVGVGMNGAVGFETQPIPANAAFATKSIGDSPFVGAGVGYEWNKWLRVDVTGEYRAKTQVSVLGHYTQPPAPTVFVDTFQGNVSSWVFLANAYVDLGTWDCFTPFVGAGIGTAVNTVSDFSDVSPTVPGGPGSSFGVGRGASTWNLAWALYAGLTYNVSPSLKLDLTYRYLSLGKAKDVIDCNGGCGGTSVTIKDLYSNDFMLGFRWECCEVVPPPPLQSRG
jgi:opacity protein-like surface antigen